MDSQTRKGLESVINILNEAATEIRILEDEAQKALHNENDEKTYGRRMEEKTILLTELHERTGNFMDGMEKGVRLEIQGGIENFAHRAEMALETGSLFYMYALLYPEDYKEGDKNDLENYVESLKQRFAE